MNFIVSWLTYKLPVFPGCQLSLQQSNTQDTLLVLSYVRRAAHIQLIKQFLLLLVQGKPLFKHRGYRFNKNVESFNTYYPLHLFSFSFLFVYLQNILKYFQCVTTAYLLLIQLSFIIMLINYILRSNSTLDK